MRQRPTAQPIEKLPMMLNSPITPIDQIVTRASYNTGFRVPTFNQLFFGVTESPYSGKDLVDPGKCPTGKVDTTKPGCESITPTTLTGGSSGALHGRPGSPQQHGIADRGTRQASDVDRHHVHRDSPRDAGRRAPGAQREYRSGGHADGQRNAFHGKLDKLWL